MPKLFTRLIESVSRVESGDITFRELARRFQCVAKSISCMASPQGPVASVFMPFPLIWPGLCLALIIKAQKKLESQEIPGSDVCLLCWESLSCHVRGELISGETTRRDPEKFMADI